MTTEPEHVEAFADSAPLSAHSSHAPIAAVAPASGGNKEWYVLRVQVGREDTIKDNIERRIKIEALEERFGQIYIPVEQYTERRGEKGEKVVIKRRKLYPGYLMVQLDMEDNRLVTLLREVSGVGEFLGGTLTKPPAPMSPVEVQRMLHNKGEKVATVVSSKPKYQVGDRVKIKDGPFSGMDGEVKDIMEQASKVKVEVTIIGRSLAVELEYWQVEEF